MYRDRITGATAVDTSGLPGQFVILGPGWVEGESLGHGDYVVAPRAPRPVVVVTGDDSTRFNLLEEPETLDAVALDGLAPTLETHAWTWMGLAVEAPVVAVGLDARSRMLDADHAIEEHLPHLATVAHEPKTRLRESRELTPIGRVRRPARGAVARLAGHSEDWYRRRFRSVEPKRLLSRRLDLDMDLYENRVAVALLDPELPAYLNSRLRELARLQSAYTEVLRALDEGTHWRRKRIYDLWRGEFESAGAVSDARDRTVHTIRQLGELLGRVRRIHASPLFAELRGAQPGGRTLRRTNILANDQHYRRVAQLWEAVVEDRGGVEAISERIHRLQQRHHAMAQYVASLVARILTSMGYEPEGGEDPPTGPGEPKLRLTGPWGAASFSWDSDDTFRIGHGSAEVRIVPLAIDIVTAAADRSDGLSSLYSASPDVVLAYLGSGVDQHTVSDAEVVGYRSLEGRPSANTLAVTPIEPTSIERLGRPVFRAVLEPVVSKYPPALRVGDRPVPPRLREVIARLAYIEVDGEATKLTRPLDYPDLAALDGELRGVEEAAAGPGWQRDHLRFLTPLRRAVEDANAQVSRLLNCPVCLAPNHVRRWSTRGSASFEVHCAGCDSRWGLDVCGNCAGRFPILDLPQLDENLDVNGAGWVARILGRDAFASPCWARIKGDRTFICPSCGNCGAAGTMAAARCERCFGHPEGA